MKFKQILLRIRVRKTMGTTVVIKDKACSICSFLCHIKFYKTFILAVQQSFPPRFFLVSEGIFKMIILLLQVMLLEHLDHSTRTSFNPVLEPKLNLNLCLLNDKDDLSEKYLSNTSLG